MRAVLGISGGIVLAAGIASILLGWLDLAPVGDLGGQRDEILEEAAFWFIFVLPVAIVCGVPLLLLARRFDRLNLATVAVSGALVGAVIGGGIWSVIWGLNASRWLDAALALGGVTLLSCVVAYPVFAYARRQPQRRLLYEDR